MYAAQNDYNDIWFRIDKCTETIHTFICLPTRIISCYMHINPNPSGADVFNSSRKCDVRFSRCSPSSTNFKSTLNRKRFFFELRIRFSRFLRTPVESLVIIIIIIITHIISARYVGVWSTSNIVLYNLILHSLFRENICKLQLAAINARFSGVMYCCTHGAIPNSWQTKSACVSLHSVQQCYFKIQLLFSDRYAASFRLRHYTFRRYNWLQSWVP